LVLLLGALSGEHATRLGTTPPHAKARDVPASPLVGLLKTNRIGDGLNRVVVVGGAVLARRM
jgi:hypothetical protein